MDCKKIKIKLFLIVLYLVCCLRHTVAPIVQALTLFSHSETIATYCSVLDIWVTRITVHSKRNVKVPRRFQGKIKTN